MISQGKALTVAVRVINPLDRFVEHGLQLSQMFWNDSLACVLDLNEKRLHLQAVDCPDLYQTSLGEL